MPPLLNAADLGYEPMDCKLSPAAQVSSSRPSRSVCFLEKHNTVREFESIDNNDLAVVRELWYQQEDMHDCKQALRLKAHHWRQTGLGILLNDTFHDPNPLLCQKRLNAFARLPDEMYVRGIERHLSKQHDMQRTRKKRSNIQDVLVQARSLDGVKSMPLEEKQKVLALFSRHLSRDAEVLARRLGKADEVAIQEGDDPTAADIMYNYLKQLEREQKMEQQRQLRQQRHKQQQQQQGGRSNGHTSNALESDQAQPLSKPIPSIRDMRYQARPA